MVYTQCHINKALGFIEEESLGENMQNVTVYTKNNCIQCLMTKKTLTQYGISYSEKNVENDAEALAFLKDKGYQSVPVVFSEDMEPVRGFRPDLLAKLSKVI